jgi:hypothetical protein
MTIASPKLPVAGSARPAEGHRAHMSRLARQSFRPHDDRDRVEALGRFAGRNTIVGSDEGQRHEVGHFRHGSLLARIGVKSPAHIGVRDSLHQFAYLRLQIFVRNDQRTHAEMA